MSAFKFSDRVQLTSDEIEHIAPYLRNDANALGSLFRACNIRQWTMQHLRSLHCDVCLGHTLFASLYLDADITRCVKHLIVEGRKRPIGLSEKVKLNSAILRRILKSFPNVSHLELVGCSWEHEEDIAWTPEDTRSLRMIRKLSINTMGIYEPSDNPFATLSVVLPSLECLELNNISITAMDLKVPPAQTVSTFHTLIVRDTENIRSFQQVLHPILQQCPLTSLFIEGFQTPDEWMLLNETIRDHLVTVRYDTYIVDLGPNLSHLWTSMHLTQFSKLKSLRIVIRPNQYRSHIRALQHLPPSLEFLTFELYWSHEGSVMPSILELDGDYVQGHALLRHDLNVRFMPARQGAEFTPAIGALLRDLMPRLHSTNRLIVLPWCLTLGGEGTIYI